MSQVTIVVKETLIPSAQRVAREAPSTAFLTTAQNKHHMQMSYLLYPGYSKNVIEKPIPVKCFDFFEEKVLFS